MTDAESNQVLEYALVRLEGPVEHLRMLRSGPGRVVVYESAALVEGGRATVDVYTTDEALGELTGPGVSMHVIQSKEELARHYARIRQQVEGASGTAMIEISATLDRLRELLTLEGLWLEPHHLVKAKKSEWTITGEATSDALEFLRANKYTTKVVVDADEMARRIDLFYGSEEEE